MTDVSKLKNELTGLRRTIGILIGETEGTDRAQLLADVKKMVDQSSAAIYHAQKRDAFGR
jgi:hypothetical protein